MNRAFHNELYIKNIFVDAIQNNTSIYLIMNDDNVNTYFKNYFEF